MYGIDTGNIMYIVGDCSSNLISNWDPLVCIILYWVLLLKLGSVDAAISPHPNPLIPLNVIVVVKADAIGFTLI
jgi:hypothetical protein